MITRLLAVIVKAPVLYQHPVFPAPLHFPRNRKEVIFTLIWLLLCAYFVDCARYFQETLSITV